MFVLVLSNQAPREVLSTKTVDPTEGAFAVQMSQDGVSYTSYVRSDWGLKDKAFQVGVYRPGETLKVPILIVQGKDKSGERTYLLPMAGKYFVRCSVIDADYKNPTVTDVATLDVQEPTGTDSEVWQQIEKTSYPTFVEYLHATKSDFDLFMKIVQDYAQSAYSAYLALAIGKTYLNTGRESLALSSKYLEIAAKSTRAVSLREEAMALWTQVLFDLDQKPKAAGIARQFLTEFPESQHRAAVQHCLNRATAPKPPLEAVEDELKVLGYDLTVLSTDEGLSQKWFDAVFGTTDNELVAGRISNAQYDATLANRYKAWVLENLKPALTNSATTTTTNSLPSTTNSPLPSSP